MYREIVVKYDESIIVRDELKNLHRDKFQRLMGKKTDKVRVLGSGFRKIVVVSAECFAVRSRRDFGSQNAVTVVTTSTAFEIAFKTWTAHVRNNTTATSRRVFVVDLFLNVRPRDGSVGHGHVVTVFSGNTGPVTGIFQK